MEANADCSDVQPAPGVGRWYSHKACDLKPPATTIIPSIPINSVLKQSETTVPSIAAVVVLRQSD